MYKANFKVGTLLPLLIVIIISVYFGILITISGRWLMWRFLVGFIDKLLHFALATLGGELELGEGVEGELGVAGRPHEALEGVLAFFRSFGD